MTAPVAFQVALFTALGQFAGLNALVGARIYPDLAPQDVVKPYVVWKDIFLAQVSDMGGSAESGGLNNFRIQITSWADGTKGATVSRQVDAQVKLAMIAANAFKSLLVDSRSLGFESDTKLYGYQSDFSIWIKT